MKELLKLLLSTVDFLNTETTVNTIKIAYKSIKIIANQNEMLLGIKDKFVSLTSSTATRNTNNTDSNMMLM